MSQAKVHESSLDVIRTVTGVDAGGRAAVLSRFAPTCVKNMHGVEIAEPWRFGAPVRAATEGGDISPDDWELVPPKGGLAWRLVRFTTSSPDLKSTPTIDLVVVTEGRVDLILETETIRLGVNDAAVIQECLHGWRLVDDAPCTMVALMVTPAVPQP